MIFKDPRLSLMAIQDRHVYLDVLSLESTSSGRVKSKYKLAGLWPEDLRNEGVRLFFVSTGQEGRSSVDDEICVVHPDDYLECSSNALRTGTSRYNLLKREVLDAKTIHQKRTDPRNRFRDVATIKDDAFDRFNDKLSRLRLKPDQPPKDIANIVKSVVSSEMSDTKLRQLHII